MTKYEDAIPIQTRQHSVWVVEMPNEPSRICIWHKDATVGDVIRYFNQRFRGLRFRVGLLGVGEHVIARTDHSYMDDARFVDQDMNVSLAGYETWANS